MVRLASLVAVITVLGCGRVGFESQQSILDDAGGDGATGDGATGDATSGGDGPGGDASLTCPRAVPAMCEPCTGSELCTYGGICCVCDGAGWSCTTANDPSCPPTAPAPFSACSAGNCSYCPNSFFNCFMGQWQPYLLSCG